jgi:hypothetical protein
MDLAAAAAALPLTEPFPALAVVAEMASWWLCSGDLDRYVTIAVTIRPCLERPTPTVLVVGAV